jgi:hypothetical protein
MRLRPRKIRTQLVTLLLVPLLSLTGLWMYSTYASVREALVLVGVTDTFRYYGTPIDNMTKALQAERRAAVVYAASGGRSGAARLDSARQTTDRRLAVVAAHAREHSGGPALTGEQKQRLSELLNATGALSTVRSEVRGLSSGWSRALDIYSSVIDAGFRVRGSLAELQTGEIARQGMVAIEIVRARELLSREDASMAAARAAGGMSSDEYRSFLGDISGRELLLDVYTGELTGGSRDLLESVENGGKGAGLRSVETLTRSADPASITAVVDASQWNDAVRAVLDQMDVVNTEAAADVARSARSNGTMVLVRAGAVGLAGLVAVVLSVVVSMRLSRRIARRLTTLRDEALELSGNRLPEVIRRLRSGEDLDDEAVARAAPVLALGGDEIGQVGRAFTTAQRAAVHSAVEQERLRRGVSAVFTNLARRSQVLLHRQLALLDTMQRRTQDPAELEDLFRLDHMTTRMRRHAEGLLILSGSSPGRAWRRPVRIAEVVRAAVGEIEDYPRVVVRRMPRLALLGPAVADVLHLLAELLENATAFSPPETKVVVSGEPVGGGYVLEIEDRGLGMSPERLAEAKSELGEAAAGLYLPETDRLGLFTVGRLAARQGVRVTLKRGAYGGTVASVLIPSAVLVDAADDDPSGEYGLRPRAVPESAGSAPARVPAPAPAPAPARAPAPVVAAASAHAAAGMPAAGASAAVPGGTTDRTGVGLPKRVRQANLVPQLKDGLVEQGEMDTAETSLDGMDRERSPEAARSTMAAYARGVARGRAGMARQRTGEIGGKP